ncbi:MAG: hypothetical protein COA88_03115 [Kordia sp.]|nr:MAG: hypothetical protein COA88_03115 [Kordia sp.]
MKITTANGFIIKKIVKE